MVPPRIAAGPVPFLERSRLSSVLRWFLAHTSPKRKSSHGQSMCCTTGLWFFSKREHTKWIILILFNLVSGLAVAQKLTWSSW